MTEATLKRELRILVDNILSKYGIDNLQLSIDLCAGAREMYEEKTLRTPAQVRAAIEIALLRGAETRNKQKILCDEVERDLHRNIPWSDERWKSLPAFLEKMTENGQTWSEFWKWHNQKEFRALSAEYLTGHKIIDWWPQAFKQNDEYDIAKDTRYYNPEEDKGKVFVQPPPRRRNNGHTGQDSLAHDPTGA